jgi:siroheme synthase
MAAKTFPAIVDKLLESGWEAATPVSCVHALGRPEQVSLTSTLEAVAADPMQLGAKSPCIIIVGRVANGVLNDVS